MKGNVLHNTCFAGLSKIPKVLGIFVFMALSIYSSQAQTLWLRAGNNIASVDATNPGNVLTSGSITGVASGQTIEGMDFRPNTGQLYLLGYESASGISQLYTLNLTTFAASAVGSVFALELAQSGFGFDFNPTVDRIRVTTSQNKNYRIHPVTGAIAATDGDLAYAAGDTNEGTTPVIGSVSYTNSYIGATSTTLYTYDDDLDVLNTQNPPNNGVQNTVGSTGLAGVGTGELDIYYDVANGTNTAYFKQDLSAGISQLYTINLSSGITTMVGELGTTFSVEDIASQINVAPLSDIEGQLVYGLTSNGYLISFDSENPEILRTHQSIGGVTMGQVLSGLDSRPVTGQLYSLGYNTATGEAQLYTINTTSGAATAVGNASTLAAGMSNVSFDFNPTVDRIRVTSAQDNNYRLHPVTGAIAATDGTLAYAAADANAGVNPNSGAGAYTNSYIGATSTQLFNYDVTLNVITLQNPPNDGILNTVGASGITVNTTDPSIDMDFFFDTDNGSNVNYLVANTGTSTFDNLYTVNTATGSVTEIGKIGLGTAVSDIAIQIVPDIPASISGQLIYGLTSNGYLISFDSDEPSVVRTQQSVSGLMAGQVLVGMDSRPNTGELYALGYNTTSGEAQLYVINTTSGAASPVGNISMLASGMTNISFDFNPTVDRIRVTSLQDNNYRLHPVTGAIAATDGTLAYAGGDANAGVDPNSGAGAYTNSYIGATSTQLFNYDVALNIITLQNPPNDGILNTVGVSGITVSTTDPSVDMDFYFNPVTGMNRTYLVANTTNNFDDLYLVNINTGEVTSQGKIGNGTAVIDIAVQIIPNKPAEVSGEIVYGITTNNYLITFDSEAPQIVRTHTAISGVTAGQVISGMDVRPATGQLYALGYNAASGEAQLYTINPATAAATIVAVPVILEVNLGNIGFDFNPTVDRIRVISSTGFNYRLHPETGAVAATDGNLAYNAGDVNNGIAPKVGSGAYTNSYGGTNNTKLFVYDDALNIIALQNPPNNGTLNTIGSSGVIQSTTDMSSDMDIFYNHTEHSNTAYMIVNVATADNLYTVNTTTGALTSVGMIGNGIAVRDIAVRIDSITSVTSTTGMITVNACNSYTAPDNKVYTASGTYTAIIPNTAGYDSLITITLTIEIVDITVVKTDSTTLMVGQSGASYQWIDCVTNLPVDGATSQSYAVTASGSYAVIITSAAGCVDTSDCVEVTTLNNNDLEYSGLNIFPNPSNGLYTLTLNNEAKSALLVISDINGRELQRRNINGKTATIDLSQLQNGIYILRIGNAIQKLIKH